MIPFWGMLLKLGIPKVFGWLKGRQEQQKQAAALKAEWELAAMRRSSTFLRVVAFVTIWGPLYHAYYLAMTVTEIKTPEDVGQAIEATLSGFPGWWTAAAVTILLAVWGLKEKAVMDVERATADKKKAESETVRDRARATPADPPRDLP